jgi:hypothetical protein
LPNNSMKAATSCEYSLTFLLCSGAGYALEKGS